MSLALFAAAVFLAAFVQSLPIGPVQMEVWRESLAGRRACAAAYVAGAMSGDVVWALAAAFGLNPVASPGRTTGSLFLAYGIVLISFGVLALLKSLGRVRTASAFSGPGPAAEGGPGLRKRWTLVRGFILVAMNPLGAASWTLILAWLIHRGAPPPVRLPEAAVYALAVAAGMAVSPGLIIFNARRWMPKRVQASPSVLPGLLSSGIIAFGLFFLYRAVRVLLWL